MYDEARKFLYYEDLHYIDPEKKKSPLWAASALIYSKFYSSPLVDAKTVEKFKEIDAGELHNRGAYKKMFDPPDPSGNPGGEAKYVSTDWKANPIAIHINNIVEANMEKIPKNLYCKAIDEFAMLKQQKENQRILGRREFIKFINEFNKKLGYPELKQGDDPFKFVEQMRKKNTQPAKSGKAPLAKRDMPTTLLDSIKASIDDNEDLALFNEYIYKGDVEIAIELGLSYYFKKNKFDRIGERLITDIRRYNRACGRWYTSKTTGRPIAEYLEPDKVYTSSFNEADGRDISYWYVEYDVTFGDFVKMIGRGLTKDQLERIFERNKTAQAAHGLSWNECTSSQRNGARIRIGYHEVLSQDCNLYAKGDRNGNLRYKPKPFDWNPSTNAPKKYKDIKDEKHYNVWYKFYYIPWFNGVNMGGARITDFVDQAEFIFDLGKVQDQQRYGDDDRNAQCSLVIWKKSGMSFAEIMERYMTKIHYLWQKYQNYIAQNDVYKVYANKMVESMMGIAEEGDKKSTAASKMEWLKMLEQTGKGISEMTDSHGNSIDPIKWYKIGYGAAAIEVLNQMKELYNQLTTALAISDIREGIDPKPRTSLGGIQLSLAASNNGTFFIEKGYMDMTLEFANRFMNYMNQIVEEGDSDRLNEFKDIVGLANGLAYEAIGDIPKHKLGMFVDNVNTDEQKQYLVNLADQLVKAGQLDIEALNLIVKVENYKYAAVLMIMKFKQKQKQIQEQKDKEFNQLMMAKEKDLQIVSQQFLAKEQAKTVSIDREGQWDEKIERVKAELRAQTQAMVKEIIKNNRIEEKVAESNIEKQAAVA